MRLIRWIAILVGVVALGAASGRLFGGWMSGLSPDYPAPASDFARLGTKLGLVAGSVLGACDTLGCRAEASVRRVALAVAATAGVALLLPSLAGLLLSIGEVRALYAADLLDVRLDRLVSPSRYVLFRGLRQAAVAGALAGSAIGGAILWRGRSSPKRPGSG